MGEVVEFWASTRLILASHVTVIQCGGSAIRRAGRKLTLGPIKSPEAKDSSDPLLNPGISKPLSGDLVVVPFSRQSLISIPTPSYFTCVVSRQVEHMQVESHCVTCIRPSTSGNPL